MTSSTHCCQRCAEDYTRHMAAVDAQLSSSGWHDIKPFPIHDCQRPDCMLSEAMLNRIGQRDPALAMQLRSLRSRLIARGPRQQEWQQHQEVLEEGRQRLMAPAAPVTTPEWDHSVPLEIRAVLAAFDDERTAWLRLEQGWVSAHEDNKHILALYGPQRSGKSCAAGRWCEQRSGRYVTAAHLAALDEAKNKGELKALQTTAALVVDDLGRTPLAEWQVGRVVELLRVRAEAGLDTTLTMVSALALPAQLVKRTQITKAV